MANSMSKLLPLLQAIEHAKQREQKIQILSHLRPDSFESICTCLRNLINNKSKLKLGVPRTRELQTVLSGNRKAIRFIIDPKRKTNKKQKLIVQKGGAIGFIIASLLPLIVDQIIKAVKRKK
jgi:hypothetical protein